MVNTYSSWKMKSDYFHNPFEKWVKVSLDKMSSKVEETSFSYLIFQNALTISPA